MVDKMTTAEPEELETPVEKPLEKKSTVEDQ